MITLKPILRTSTIYFIALVAIGLSGIFISRTLPSNMDSALFIAQKELQELRDYHKEFGLNNIIVITTTTPQRENLILKQIQLLSSNFVEETLVLTPFAENKNTSSVMISVTSTEYKDLLENFDLLSRLLDKGFKEWSIAGNLWTNYHLAKQNIDIQERIFPAIFILIGVLLVIFLRNIVLSLVIFLVSLSCTGYSFLLIKLIKNEVHLLTNIVPLMNFVIPTATTTTTTAQKLYQKQQQRQQQQRLS